MNGGDGENAGERGGVRLATDDIDAVFCSQRGGVLVGAGSWGCDWFSVRGMATSMGSNGFLLAGRSYN